MGTINKLLGLVIILMCIFYVYFTVSSRNRLNLGQQLQETSMFTLSKETYNGKTYDDRYHNQVDDILILYNRVPKTGSTSFMSIVYKLHSRNHFSAAYVNVSSSSHRWKFNDQYRFARNITRWKKRIPGIYHGHFPFLNFMKMGLKQPIYINIVRDPLERLVSHYYFLRYGDTYLPNKVRQKQGDKTTFDECVKQKKPECHPNKLWIQIPYFCGSDPDCWKPGNKAALHRAQRNVIHYYTLVGTTNKLGSFIKILETIFPRMFSGATKLFGPGVYVRKTKVKKPLQPETLKYFKASKVWRLEQEFYEFIVRRFEDIEKEINTASRISYVKVKP